MLKRIRHLACVVGLLIALATPASVLAGYSHYWNWRGQPDQLALQACIAEMRSMLEAGKDIVAGPDGSGTPMITERELHFNGVGPDSHESFTFPGREGFNFCKTAHKPYDRVVTACLLVAADHFSTTTLEIASDGRWAAGDWHPGASLYRTVLQRSPHNPLRETTPSPDYSGGSMFWTSFAEFLPWLPTVFVLVVFIVVMKRTNFGGHVAQQREHMAKAQVHMRTVETLLTRIAEALEKQAK